MTTGKLLLEEPGGTAREAPLTAGKPYFRRRGRRAQRGQCQRLRVRLHRDRDQEARLSPAAVPLSEAGAEVLQHQLVDAAAGADAAQGAVEVGFQLGIRLRHRDCNALAEIARFQERAATQLAAFLRRRAVDPQHQADAVVEHQVELALHQRVAGALGRFERLDLTEPEEFRQIRLVRRALDHADAPAFETVRRDLELDALARTGETGRGVEVAIGKVDQFQGLSIDHVSGDGGIGLAAGDRHQKFLPWPHLDVTGNVELEADGAGQIDVEAGQHALVVEIVERRILALGQHPQHHPPLGGGRAFRQRRGLRHDARGDARQRQHRHRGKRELPPRSPYGMRLGWCHLKFRIDEAGQIPGSRRASA